jgi:hypothetical protein
VRPTEQCEPIVPVNRLADLLAARRVLAEAVLAERMSHIDTLESDSRLRLDLHEMWDFDD